MPNVAKTVDSKYSHQISDHIDSMIDPTFSESIKWDAKHLALVDVEKYIKHKIKETKFTLSYDVTAIEELNFKTINYTTFAGSLILHPLNFEQSLRQMSDAYADQLKGNHISHLQEHIKEGNYFSKYSIRDVKKAEAKEALVILTGGNKLKKHCCAGKLKYILNKHGKDNVLFKKHPVSHDDIYEELSEFLGGINFADGHSDLFQLIKKSKYIYSTMMSESALIANILGKEVDHFDLLQNRNTTSFGHINYYLYSTPKPLEWAATAFASPKSGVINPIVDINWAEKVDAYFDYITELHSFYDKAYIMSDSNGK